MRSSCLHVLSHCRQHHGMWEREFFFDQTEGRFDLCEDESMLENGVLTMVLKHLGDFKLGALGIPGSSTHVCGMKVVPQRRDPRKIPCHDHPIPVFQNSWGHHVQRVFISEESLAASQGALGQSTGSTLRCSCARPAVLQSLMFHVSFGVVGVGFVLDNRWTTSNFRIFLGLF